MLKSIKQAFVDLDSPDDKIRLAAIQYIRSRRSKQALHDIVSAMDAPNSGARSVAAIEIGKRSIIAGHQALIDHLLGDPSMHVRRSCAMALHLIHSESFIPVFIKALSDSSQSVVGFACAALGEFSHHDAIDALQGMLKHPSWNIRLTACASLVELKQVNDEVVVCLEQLHEEPEALKHNVEAKKVNTINREIGGLTAGSIMHVTDDLLRAARLILNEGNL